MLEPVFEPDTIEPKRRRRQPEQLGIGKALDQHRPRWRRHVMAFIQDDQVGGWVSFNPVPQRIDTANLYSARGIFLISPRHDCMAGQLPLLERIRRLFQYL